MASAAKPLLREQGMQFSADFRAWLDLARQCETALHQDETRLQAIWTAMEPLERRIFAQPVGGLADARVVAEIGMVALLWTIKQSDDPNKPNSNDPFLLGADCSLSSEYRDTRSAAHLIQAAAKLVVGGANG